MVISDFNLICVQQFIPKLIACYGIGVDVIKSHNYYGRHWKSLKKTSGVWYQFYPLKRMVERRYDDEFFDLTIQKEIYHIIPLENHKDNFKKIIDSYLMMSPIHEIFVLIRLDEHGESKEIVRIKSTEFITRFDRGKLLFNKIYHVYL